MSWYTRTSSIKDDKEKQRDSFIRSLEEASRAGLIGGEEPIKIVQDVLDKLEGVDSRVRLLLPNNVSPYKEEIIELLHKAIKTKKDSPQKFVNFIEEALVLLS